MACKLNRDANPDIAGIGVILAFGLQALISLLLSATARFLLSKYLPLRRQDRKTLWRRTRENLSGCSRFSLKSFRDGWHNAKTTQERSISPKIQNFVEVMNKILVNRLKDHLDPSCGLSEDDSSTLKRLRLGRFTNSLHEELLAESRRTHIRSKFSGDITNAEEKVQELICKVLLVASDGQTMTGIALIITAMAQQKSLSRYHLFIVYNTINFTTVSNIAAMSCVYDTDLESKRVHYYTLIIFGLLYTGFTCLLGIRLNDDLPGGCYGTSEVVSPKVAKLLSEAGPSWPNEVYLGVTSFYFCFLMFIATILHRRPSKRLSYQKVVVMMCTLQFVVHGWAVVDLKIRNEPFLDNVTLENKWGFGQVVAMMMLTATLLECARGFEEYFSWKKKKAATSGNALELNDLEQEVAP